MTGLKDAVTVITATAITITLLAAITLSYIATMP